MDFQIINFNANMQVLTELLLVQNARLRHSVVDCMGPQENDLDRKIMENAINGLEDTLRKITSKLSKEIRNAVNPVRLSNFENVFDETSRRVWQIRLLCGERLDHHCTQIRSISQHHEELLSEYKKIVNGKFLEAVQLFETAVVQLKSVMTNLKMDKNQLMVCAFDACE